MATAASRLSSCAAHPRCRRPAEYHSHITLRRLATVAPTGGYAIPGLAGFAVTGVKSHVTHYVHSTSYILSQAGGALFGRRIEVGVRRARALAHAEELEHGREREAATADGLTTSLCWRLPRTAKPPPKFYADERGTGASAPSAPRPPPPPI